MVPLSLILKLKDGMFHMGHFTTSTNCMADVIMNVVCLPWPSLLIACAQACILPDLDTPNG